MGKAELKLEIDADLLRRALSAGISLQDELEAAIRAKLPEEDADARARRWAEENAEAIKAHKERIEKYGVFGEDFRTW